MFCQVFFPEKSKNAKEESLKGNLNFYRWPGIFA